MQTRFDLSNQIPKPLLSPPLFPLSRLPTKNKHNPSETSRDPTLVNEDRQKNKTPHL